MSEVVWPRPAACAAAVQADLADERGERLVELVAADPSSARGEEERLRCRLREAGVTLQDVVSQRGDSAVVQRDLTLFLLLARADENHTVAQIDVVAVQRQRFSRPHRGDREQPDQRLMTYRAQPRREPPSGRDQCRDFLTGVDVGGDPWPVSWKQEIGRAHV